MTGVQTCALPIFRTVLLGFTLEAAYGWARTEGPGLPARTVGSFNFQIGTLPFDLWRRH